MRKAWLLLLALVVLAAALSPGLDPAQAAEPVVVPTSATINKGKLIDEYPGPPPPGSTDLDLPFYGKITSEHPACRIRRAYELGAIEPDGAFREIGATTVPANGKWTFGLAGKISHQWSIAIRVPPRQTTYHGMSYLCDEAISSPVTEDSSDFTHCRVARAAKRGYVPATRSTKWIIRKAEARNDEETARIYQSQLREFRGYWPSIKRAVAQRC